VLVFDDEGYLYITGCDTHFAQRIDINISGLKILHGECDENWPVTHGAAVKHGGHAGGDEFLPGGH